MTPGDALPPGPRGTLLQTARYIRDPYAFYARCRRRFGDLFTLPTLRGPLVITGDPEGVREFFTADPDHFTIWGTETIVPMIGERSVLTMIGDSHRRARKLLTPPFHGQRMRAYGRTMAEVALGEAAAWPRTPFDMLRSTQAISLSIILRAVFGVTAGAELPLFREAVLAYMRRMNSPVFFFPFLQRRFGGVGPWARFLRARDRLLALLQQKVEAARRQPVAGEDILSQLCAARYDDGSPMDDGEIRDHLVTLLLAGHETSAQAMAWACYFLHRDPALLGRLRQELDGLGPDRDPEAVAALPLLEAVCNESLRINPIINEVPRLLVRPLALRGRTVPAGVAVGPSVVLLHRREDLYPAPEEFRPERFLQRRYSPFEFLPFGGGHRRCIGAAFALYEMKIVLHTLLSRFQLRLATDRPIRPAVRGVTMGPKGGVPMVLAS